MIDDEVAVRAEQASTIEEVWELLDAAGQDAEGVDEEVKYLIAAALESDASFDAQLSPDAEPTARPDRTSGREASPVKAYLRSITVAGFRGIGPESVLPLTPTPGLTVVSGRNGSGKSSFSEALECAITGSSHRWSAKNQKFWQEGWRNLHRDIECRVGVGLVQQPEEAAEPPTNLAVSVKWTGDDVADCERFAKPDGGDRRPAEEVLGWRRPVELYRPILSYEELGNLFGEGRAALYDALNQILGLDEITAAAKRIDDRLKELGDARKRANSARTAMRRELKESDLDQAKAVFKATQSRSCDLDTVRTLVSGSTSPHDRLVVQLRMIAEELTVADELAVSARVAELRAAVDESLASGDRTLRLLGERTALLDGAVRYLREQGGDDCPVCESPLPDNWILGAEAKIAESRTAMEANSWAIARLRDMEQQVRELLGELVIPVLETGPDIDLDVDLPEYAAYRSSVEAARNAPDSAVELAQHATDSLAAAAEALEALRPPAAALAQKLDDAWAPLALTVMSWIQLESQARPLDASVARLKAAKEWLHANADVLRARRMAPIEAQAKRIWSELRQQSDVDLTSISLTGRATSRRVDLEGTVGGQKSSVLPMMSQGELQALALALFIPRATLPASPFGFLVLDDPIQAMDPAKIDGFLRVLQELAKTRQVIVFSHDDRLPSAIRRLAVDAQLLLVSREPGSRVAVEPADVPADRVFANARSLIVDTEIPDAVKNDAGPGLFRMTVESAARQKFFAEAPRRGLSQQAAEGRWASAQGAKALVSLALDVDDDGYKSWLHVRDHRKNVLRIITHGTHHGSVLDRSDLNDLRAVVDDLLGRRRG
ncbi:hypothetical protein C6V83_13645 [Gordonia iterans]|uniref:Nuclease SbcCD subunit C n=1 Tax=Gordonia iterans TaxID=1004901 RepID=A0A2S0KHL2_9ACTN|nr:AAA family ATPase [Gordonia iterans]AVM01136.1 hypothetical protein C6V83_13645 [Gordonia iterans]